MKVAKSVEQHFASRLEKCLNLIQEYGITYEEIGVFGSYAREDYLATSDIDICIITEERPERRISGELREEAEELRIDIVYVTREYYENSTEPFARQLRRDYRKVV